MIYECKLLVYSEDEKTEELLGKVDKKFIPFAFLLDVVYGVRMASDDIEDIDYGCTALHCDDKQFFIIDTPFNKFLQIWKNYINGIDDIDIDDDEEII
jgi:hypothetical protein